MADTFASESSDQSPSEFSQDAHISHCPHCSAELGDKETKFCQSCGYPARGSSQEQSNFKRKIQLQKEVLADAQKKVKRVSLMLYILGGINLVVGIFLLNMELGFDSEMKILGWATLINAAVLIACGLWVKKKPVTGVLVAFSFYLVIQIAGAVIDPSTIFQGIILKIIILAIFIRGLKSAYDYKEYQKKLSEHAA